jgi:general secretion pathway protein A
MANDILGDARVIDVVRQTNAKVLTYFNLIEHPYQGGPDYCFLYSTDQVKEAQTKALIITAERISPIYLYGSNGIGKTTIIQRLYKLLKTDPVFDARYIILHNRVTANTLLRDLLALFEVKTERSYDESLKNFQLFLLGKLPPEKSTKKPEKNALSVAPENVSQTPKVPLLMLDEAQYLSRDALKLIHTLLNYESTRVKRIQIILAGQEKLAANILKMGELASRMKSIQLYNMTPDELRKMLMHRWVVAGGKEEDFPFEMNDSEVFGVLYDYTKGLPRDAIKVTASEVETIAKENNLQKPKL